MARQHRKFIDHAREGAINKQTTQHTTSTTPRHVTPCASLIFRANLFPKVTDLFCRLPSLTLSNRLEATHLDDLMRLLVRPRDKIISRCPLNFHGLSTVHQLKQTQPDTKTVAHFHTRHNRLST